MRQFDVFVWGVESFEPPFTDNALGWFYGNDLNSNLENSEAEWTVFAHSTIAIDRQFLNDLAECTSGYPMVDAFAPRIHDRQSGKFLSGYALDKKTGLKMLDENAKMRFVAAPHPYLAVFSRRIVQRTGRLDDTLVKNAMFADYAFRMLHAGGKMFSVPYLVACTTGDISKTDAPEIQNPQAEQQEKNDLAYALVKSFGIPRNIRFLARNPKAFYFIWKNRKEIFEKRDKATLLSKFKNSDIAELF